MVIFKDSTGTITGVERSKYWYKVRFVPLKKSDFTLFFDEVSIVK